MKDYDPRIANMTLDEIIFEGTISDDYLTRRLAALLALVQKENEALKDSLAGDDLRDPTDLKVL